MGNKGGLGRIKCIGKEADLGLRHHSRLADACFYVYILRHGFGSGPGGKVKKHLLQLTATSRVFFSESGKHMRGSSCTVHIWGRDRRRVEDNGIHFPDSNHTEGQAHVIPAEPQCRAADQPSAPGVGIRRTSYGFCHSEVRRRRSPSQRGWEKRMRLTAIDEEWTRRSRSRGHFPCGVVTKLGPRRAAICRSPKPPASRNAASPWGRCGTFPDRPW